MPEYILPRDGTAGDPPVTFDDLDAFTQGYIEALFFTESSHGLSTQEWRDGCEPGTNDGALPGDVGFSDLDPDALASIMADCARFQSVAAPVLTAAYGCGCDDGSDYDAERAGRDFWFTRNGHGVSFWDRGLGEVGDNLAALCGWRTAFGEASAYFGDDDRVHV